MPGDLNKRWLTINNFSPEGNAWGGFRDGKSNRKGGDNDNCEGRVVAVEVAASWWMSWWWQPFVFLEMTPIKLEFKTLQISLPMNLEKEIRICHSQILSFVKWLKFQDSFLNPNMLLRKLTSSITAFRFLSANTFWQMFTIRA